MVSVYTETLLSKMYAAVSEEILFETAALGGSYERYVKKSGGIGRTDY